MERCKHLLRRSRGRFVPGFEGRPDCHRQLGSEVADGGDGPGGTKLQRRVVQRTGPHEQRPGGCGVAISRKVLEIARRVFRPPDVLMHCKGAHERLSQRDVGVLRDIVEEDWER